MVLSAPNNSGEQVYLTRPVELMLAVVTGALVANSYYIHPILAEVATDFSISPASIGLVPALNQIAVALGILILLPLGDRYSNRRLLIIFATGQTLSLLLMALSSSFIGFLVGSTTLGFCTVGPYLLPAYASKRVSPARLGAVTAIISVGTSVGVLASRIVASQIAEHYDWRLVYFFAATLMVGITLLSFFLLEERPDTQRPVSRTSHLSFAFSVLSLIRQSPRIIVSSAIQALNFGVFISVWLSLTLHLTSPEMGYGVDVVGYLAFVAVIALFTTPKVGAWADRIGAEQARFRLTAVQLCGTLLLLAFAQYLWLLLIPIILLNAIGPALDVTGRMTALSVAPEVRSRLMAGFFFTGFVGGGLASWASTASFDLAGWNGSVTFVIAMGLISIGLSWREARIARAAA